MVRFEMIDELVNLCKENGYGSDEQKIRKIIYKYSTADVVRLLDAIYRFGFEQIIEDVLEK